MSEVIKSRALVIHTRRWSESSKIVELFTPSGVIRLIAKGALRPKSRFRGVVEVLNEIEAVWTFKETRGLQILTQASLLQSFQGIRANLEKTAVAFAILETLQKLIRTREPFAAFYHYVITLLEHLNDRPHSFPVVYLWHFLVHLSSELGFALQVEYCSVCRKTPQEFPVHFNSATGAVVCARCSPSVASSEQLEVAESDYRVLNRLVRAKDVGTLKDWTPTRPHHQVTRLLLKHLAHHTDIPLELNALKWL